MSNTEIARFIVAIQNDAGQNVGLEVRPERPDGNGGFATCMARAATIDDLRAVLTEEEAEFALAGAAANARAEAAEQSAAAATETLVERDAELAELRPQLETLNSEVARLREELASAEQTAAAQREMIDGQKAAFVALKEKTDQFAEDLVQATGREEAFAAWLALPGNKARSKTDFLVEMKATPPAEGS